MPQALITIDSTAGSNPPNGTPLVAGATVQLNNNAKMQRFWSKVSKTDSCWLWTGERSQFGHGRFLYNSVRVGAHRFSYETFVGPIPDGMFVCHKCDVPQCVNPEHLFVGTQKENIQDCVRKGRWVQAKLKAQHPEWCARGEQAGNSALKTEQALTALSMLLCGVTLKIVGETFGITQATASQIRSGKTWKHIRGLV